MIVSRTSRYVFSNEPYESIFFSFLSFNMSSLVRELVTYFAEVDVFSILYKQNDRINTS